MQEFLPHPEDEKYMRQKKLNRRKFIGMSAAIAMSELLQSAHEELPQMPSLTKQQFDEMIRYEFPNLSVTVEKAAPSLMEKGGFGELELGRTAWSVLRRVGQEKPEEVIQESAEYVVDFQKPEDEPQMASAGITPNPNQPKRKFVCNKDSRNFCDGVYPKGFPVYVLNTWPENPDERGFVDWHQRAMLMLREKLFFIVDGQCATIWHGTVGSYALTKNEGSMRRLPVASIARFIKPKWDIGLSRIARVFINQVSENEMISLNLRQNSSEPVEYW